LRILVIGYGNPGRRDDGLGPALAARVEAQQWTGVTVQSDYQLMIEHSALMVGHDVVVFADAALNLPRGEPYDLQPVAAASCPSGFSHHLPPPAVLQLAADCFGARPQAWLLGIRAVDLRSYAEGLTPEAEKNLGAAFVALRDAVESWRRGTPSSTAGAFSRVGPSHPAPPGDGLQIAR
jgi:hydrogenase maturation protease